MNIIVVGCGKIGTTIVESLVSEGHDVTIIDMSADVVAEAINLFDCTGICGSGTDIGVLMECDAENCDLFISVTGSDELNMLSCFMAKRLGAEHTVARIRNPQYNDQNSAFIREQLGLSMAINPEMLAAFEIFNILKLPSAVKIETFSRRTFEMVEIRLKEDSVLDGMSLMEMRKQFKAEFLVCAISRGDEVYVPDGNFVLKSGDRIGITASPYEIIKLLKLLGLMQKKARNIMILGASRTAYYLAKLLLKNGNSVKIIESSPEKCEELSENLPEAVIIQGDAAQQEILVEEGVKNVDAFAALTGIDEENILLSLFASTQDVPKVVAKVDRADFSLLAEKIGIESCVSPRQAIADVLVSYARGLENSAGSKMETLYKIMNGKAEMLEFHIEPDCSLVDIPLKDIVLKKNVLISGIIRGRKSIIPSGEDHIAVGDIVIVLTAGGRINDISDIKK